ncbi:MAG: acyl-CoA dehydrogenase family protein [Alphaproteobacteria bacterium]|nr:acyl-CoA dehydrogenase family protein [Alphaproteobacteria bacterium]
MNVATPPFFARNTLPNAGAAGTPLAPDCHGMNFFDIDRSLQDLLPLYLPDDLREHMLPHFRRLGEIAGGRLDELARLADRHGPVLHSRDAFGRDEDWIEFHPAYREMEQIGFGDFGIHAMSRRPGVLGWNGTPIAAKYILQYLFVQSEFALMCPISATDTSVFLIGKYGDEAVRQRFLPGMTEILMGAQFMTEKTGGSDVGGIELAARLEQGPDGPEWRLYGDKWFCSCADADVALLLARPEGAVEGTAGLGLFALPKHRDDGSRNSYRIVRLKDKLGTRSMASGEIVFDGAVAYPLGDVGPGRNNGLKQMLDQVNLSRLSHGVRAAAMMRRCLNEALMAARGRTAFGGLVADKPLMRRQLLKLMVPTEQALSMALFTADKLERSEAGDEQAAALVRLLTPLLKFRTSRDNIAVATGAMEARGGNGYIEAFVNARLVRDAHLGVLWEGTSNINALDIIGRAVGKAGAQEVLGDTLTDLLDRAEGLPGQLKGALGHAAGRAVALAGEVADAGDEPRMRQASDALYHAASAVVMAHEGARIAAAGGRKRLLLAQMVLDRRLSPQDPLAPRGDDPEIAAELLEAA